MGAVSTYFLANRAWWFTALLVGPIVAAIAGEPCVGIIVTAVAGAAGADCLRHGPPVVVAGGPTTFRISTNDLESRSGS